MCLERLKNALYLRADMLRVDRSERYNTHGAAYAAVREQIKQSPA